MVVPGSPCWAKIVSEQSPVDEEAGNLPEKFPEVPLFLPLSQVKHSEPHQVWSASEGLK